MLSHSTAFAPEQYRGWLLLLAQSQWDHALRDWGDPSDLVQLTLLEAQQKLAEFKGNSTQVFAAWLKEIMTHNLLDVSRSLHRKKRDRRRNQSLEAALEESSGRLGFSLALKDPSPSNVVAAAERLNLLAKALGALPPDQREAVSLHHLRGMSLAATAAEMGSTLPSVSGLLRRGLHTLRELLGERGKP